MYAVYFVFFVSFVDKTAVFSVPNDLHRPGVQDESVLAAMDQHDVQYIQRADRADAFDQAGFAVSVQGLQREPAGIDLAAFGHELVDLGGVVWCPGKASSPKRGKPR